MFTAGDAEVAEAAQQRLLQVCRQVITRAAQDTWHHLNRFFSVWFMSFAGDPEVAEAAQQRMLQVCRQVITRAAQDTWHHNPGHHEHTGHPHHVTDGTSWEQVGLAIHTEIY